jgi:hypothetical protein
MMRESIEVAAPPTYNKYDIVRLVQMREFYGFAEPADNQPTYMLMTADIKPTMNIVAFDTVVGLSGKTIINGELRLTAEELNIIYSSKFNVIGLIF